MEKYLSIPEVAALLGIAEKTVHALGKKRGLPISRVGYRTLRVSSTKLRAWLTRQEMGK